MTATLKPGDKALIVVLLLALLAAAIFIVTTLVPRGGADASAANDLVVVCQTSDGFYRAERLDATVSFTVETPGTGTGADAEGGENTVAIKDGMVSVGTSNCSNQVCVEHDAISRVGEQIVCLPHGLVIEVLARESDATALK